LKPGLHGGTENLHGGHGNDATNYGLFSEVKLGSPLAISAAMREMHCAVA
jgi:hypothetical protein